DMAECVTLEAGDLARPEVRAAALDPMGQVACGVVGVALVAIVEADFVGQTVEEVVAELGDVADLIGDRGHATGMVVLIALRVAQRIDSEGRLSGSVALPCRGPSQRVDIADEMALPVPRVDVS